MQEEGQLSLTEESEVIHVEEQRQIEKSPVEHHSV